MGYSLNFRSKKPKHSVKKQVLVLFLIGIFFISIIFYYYFIKYAPIFNSDLPQININCEEEPNYNDFIDCKFQMKTKNNDENIDPINAQIKIRGTGTGWNEFEPKKGYRIKLNDPTSLLDMREDRDWLLFGLYSDFPRMRIKLSMDLWRTLLPSDPTAILPKSRFILLFINSEFQGLYLLSEKIDRQLFGLADSQNNVDSSLIFQIKGTSYFKVYDRNIWEQDWPNEYDNIYIMDRILTDLILFVSNSSDECFFNSETGIYSEIEKINLIDFYVYNFFILHKDFWFSNYYIVRNSAPSKFFLVPWDFDYSLGQFAWNTYKPTSDPTNEIKDYNELFKRLSNNDDFMNDCKIRWFELRKEIWSEEAILDLLQEFYEEIQDVLEIEVEMWNPRDYQEKWNNDIDVSVKHLFSWISDRLDFCDFYFSNFSTNPLNDPTYSV